MMQYSPKYLVLYRHRKFPTRDEDKHYAVSLISQMKSESTQSESSYKDALMFALITQIIR